MQPRMQINAAVMHFVLLALCGQLVQVSGCSKKDTDGYYAGTTIQGGEQPADSWQACAKRCAVSTRGCQHWALRLTKTTDLNGICILSKSAASADKFVSTGPNARKNTHINGIRDEACRDCTSSRKVLETFDGCCREAGTENTDTTFTIETKIFADNNQLTPRQCTQLCIASPDCQAAELYASQGGGMKVCRLKGYSEVISSFAPNPECSCYVIKNTPDPSCTPTTNPPSTCLAGHYMKGGTCTGCPDNTYQPTDGFKGDECSPQPACTKTQVYSGNNDKVKKDTCKSCPSGYGHPSSVPESHRQTTCSEYAPVHSTKFGTNCNCGNNIGQDRYTAAVAVRECERMCEENDACQSFGVWTGPTGRVGQCMIYDEACTDECPKPGKPTDTVSTFSHRVRTPILLNRASVQRVSWVCVDHLPRTLCLEEARLIHML